MQFLLCKVFPLHTYTPNLCKLLPGYSLICFFSDNDFVLSFHSSLLCLISNLYTSLPCQIEILHVLHIHLELYTVEFLELVYTVFVLIPDRKKMC